MALRLNSLKTRTALAIATVIVVILVANAVYLILVKRAELRQDIEEQAMLFASLTRQPVCVGYETYYASGFYKFRELMRDYLRLEDDVDRIQIINVNGKVLFDSQELDDTDSQRSELMEERWIEDPMRLEAIKRLESTPIRGVDAQGNETLEIIAPYIEDWGRHRLSVAYHVSYGNLRPQIISQIYATGGLTLVSILISVLVGVTLASRITRPLEELTVGAQEIAVGHFEQRLSIRSGDELQILSDTFNDMTERLKENVEQLEESNKKLATVNEELKELDRVKSDLLANVSHELRTPLTAIKGYTDYIRDGKLGPVTEKQERGLQVVQKNLERLSRSINDLLDFSRMEMGRISLNLQPFPLDQLVDQIHTTVGSELEKKGLDFASRIPEDLPPVIADRDKIAQVVENLVINAIKFTPEGGCIAVEAVRRLDAGRMVAEIRVSDTGIGIPPTQLAKIFSRFHQVDGSTTRRFGGVGLGLSIVKSIVDAHGSQVEVTSEEHKGTSFSFSLPLLDKSDALEAEVPAQRPETATTLTPRAAPLDDEESFVRQLRASLERDGFGSRPTDREALVSTVRGVMNGDGKGTVLVVDDEPDTVDFIRDTLRSEGFVTLAAADADVALELIRQRRPDLVLLDIMLPRMSGFEVLEALRGAPETAGIPIVVLTAAGEEGGGARPGVEPGARRYMSRPFDVQALLAEVRRQMGRGTA